jgi:prepilin-type N-terminal cleavage/methylation domain-containing protein
VKPVAHNSAFSLIELLVVISIIGILAAIAMPTLSSFRKADSMLAGSRQLLDDVGRARQLAISQHTTVYMVFCPERFWNNPTFNNLPNPGYANLPGNETAKAQRLFDKQLTAYAFVSLRSAGDQPGQTFPSYLSRWHTLPEGAIIPQFKFNPRNTFTHITDPDVAANRSFDVYGFSVTNNIPFPSEDAALYPTARPYVPLPYLAFNYLGQLTSGTDEYIPLARGAVGYVRDAGKTALAAPPTVSETPAGNSTNAFTLVHIDWLTGRARLERQEFR